MEVADLFNSVHETLTPEDARLCGTLPSWIRGVYYKMANGKFDLSSNFTVNHLFDGYALICQFRIMENKVRFRSKFLNSDAYLKAMAAGKPILTEFGTRSYPDPSKNFFSRMFSSLVPGDLTDNAALSVFHFRGKVYVASESCFIHQIDPSTLQSSAKINLNELGVNLTSSHFLEDNHGAMYNVGTSFSGAGLKYNIYRFSPATKDKEHVPLLDPTKEARVIATISPSWKTSFAYYHSFGMSENYFVFIEQPLLISSVKLLASQVQGRSFKECSYWDPEEKNKFTLVDKSTGSIVKTKFISQPFFFLHVVNTYEDCGHLVIDINASHSSTVLDCMYLDKLRNNQLDQSDPPVLQRYVLPIVNAQESKSGENLVSLPGSTAKAIKVENDLIAVQSENLCEPGFELPHINTKYSGIKHRYVYVTGLYYDSYFRKSLAKIDLETKEIQTWKDEQDRFVGEPIFIPNPSGKTEDDGVVMATVTGLEKQNSMLVFLDAISFKEIARAEFSSEVPVGNHGHFIPGDI